MKKYILILCLFLFPSCVQLAATNSVLTEKATRTHRTIEQVRKDQTLEKELRNTLKKELKIFAKINNIRRIGNYKVLVMEGRVFLIGNVAQNEINNFIYNKVWENNKVREVVNELKISLEDNERNSLKDFFIKRNIAWKFLTTGGVKSQNYDIIVDNGTAYIIGIADDDIEIRKVGHLASTASGVREAVIHVMDKNDSRRVREY